MKAHTNVRHCTQAISNRRAPLGILILIFSCLSLMSIAGCVGLTGAGTPPGKSSSNSNPSSLGTLAANATSLSFGNVVAGSSSAQTLTLTNTGGATVKISQATVSGAGFSVVGGMSSVSIPAGQNHAFEVQYTPTGAGTVSGSIFVTSDATNSPLGIALAATATAALAITSQPESQSVVSGHSASFAVVAAGTGSITYQWKKNGAAISGATSALYTTPATTSADNGTQFSVVVTDGSANVTSNPASLTVTAAAIAPSISTEPASKSVTAGQTATFSVTAAGTAPFTYQWKKNGSAIGGANSSSYTTPATTASDNNAQFSVSVTNSVSNITSSAATLTVSVPPTISAQPVSKAVTAGQTATFSVVAAGTGTLSYQWKKNGSAIGGATTSSYTTPVTTTADNGSQFTVTIADVATSITSSAAILTVSAAPVAPSITGQPSSQTVNAGQAATFSVSATGTATLTFQWKKNGAAIGGATTASYTTPATVASDSGAQFTVTVTNGTGNITSNAAVLTVNVAPTISAQPVSKTVTAGQTATFSVSATGTGTLTYQWKKNGASIGGATSATYTTPAAAASDNGATFTVTVTSGSGSVTSSTAILTVTAAPVAPSITGQPSSQTVNAGQAATFSVSATGTATLTYQWKKNGGAIGGATSASYTTPATVASDSGAQFTVTVTNGTGNITSNAAVLTVNVPPTISTQPVSKTVAVGQTATFSVSATGSGTLTYQWKKNGASIGGATSATYTTPAAAASDNGATFTVAVTSGSGSVTSSAATLTVNAPPSITAQPVSKSVMAGQTATFSVNATGAAPITYQWKKGGVAVGGATASSYTTPVTTTADNGSQFTVTVSNGAGSTTSNAATLTVGAATFLLNPGQSSLNFSSINISSNKTLPVSFTNGGNSNVTISNVSVSGAGYTASGIQTGQIVTPGQIVTLNVTFTPATSGILPGSVTVSSNATNSPASITLSGTGVQAVTHSVTLTWSASTSAVSGYNVYRSSVSGGPYTKLNSALVGSTTYLDSAVTSGQTYFYVVTSVNSSSVESADSAEVSALVP